MELNSKFIKTEDLNSFTDILKRFGTLSDNSYAEAFKLHQEALIQYDRWGTIFYQIQADEKRGGTKDVPLKNRVKQIVDILDKIYTSSRTVFVKGKNDFNTKSYGGN